MIILRSLTKVLGKAYRRRLYASNPIYIGCSLLSLLLTSCASEDSIKHDTSVIEDRHKQENAFDKWLYENYMKPYNIEVKYKFDDNESDRRYNLAPAEFHKSIQFAHLARHLCLEAYDEVTGSAGKPSRNFIRQLFPKVLHLVGSTGYNHNGTQILGTAEGGRKMTLYRINDLNPNSIAELNLYYFQTIHHEFGHIQNQTKPYPADFRQITANGYRSDTWSKAWNTPDDIHDIVYEELADGRSDKLKEYTKIAQEYYRLYALGSRRTKEESQQMELYKKRKKEMESDDKLMSEHSIYKRRLDMIKKLRVSEINALRAGFISPYASSQHYEDFVELQATFVTDAPELWDAKLFVAGNEGRELINQKFKIVSNYLQHDWGINLNALRDCVLRRQTEIENLDINSLAINTK
ncbi:MAG: putative zinc-binding metallopeptidase [Porphyromonadaceae bacterium]|nr:putative zinc-binding metallopeptidase [Porphyromonadaceae bacterium]